MIPIRFVDMIELFSDCPAGTISSTAAKGRIMGRGIQSANRSLQNNSPGLRFDAVAAGAIMPDQFANEIRIVTFDFAPKVWAFCKGLVNFIQVGPPKNQAMKTALLPAINPAAWALALMPALACPVTVSAVDAPTILPSPTPVFANSSGNQASGPGGFAGYAWTINNGVIIGPTDSQTINYAVGVSGNLALGLTGFDASA